MTNVDGYWREKVGYLEIPIHATGRLDVGKGELQLFVGPYIAFALVGRSKYDITYTDGGETVSEKESLKIKFKNTVTESDWEDYWEDDEHGGFQKLTDFGLNFGLGYYFKPVLINVGYSLGLTNLQPNEEGEDIDEYKYTNSVIFLNIAWLFECRKK